MSAEDIFLWWLLHATFGRLSGTLACCKPCLWVPPSPIITSLYYKGRELWPETLLGLGLSHHLEPWAPGNPPGPESDKIGSSKTWIPWPGGSRRPAGIPGSPSNMAVLKVYQAVIWGQGCHFIIIIFSLHNKRKLSKKKKCIPLLIQNILSQKTTYCVIPFTWSVQNRQNYEERRYINGCLGPGSKRVRGWKKMGSDCQGV